MKIFNYKIIHYKRFSAFFLMLSFFVSSMSFLIQKPHIADAAITDCTTEVGNMITNCSFEDPAVLPAGYTPSGIWGYPTFFSGYTGVTGWSFITPGTGNVTMATGFAGSAQGSRAVDVSGVIDTPAGLNGEIYGSGIEQTVTGLTPGMQYSLKFYQSHLTLAGVTYPSRINVVVDGTSLGVFSHTISTAGDSVGGQVWTQRAVTFIATGTSAVIRFLNDVPTPAPADSTGRPVDLIDNISLTTKPDTTAPTLTISNPANGAVVSGPFTATICPSEPITGLDLSDFTITNGTASGLTGPTTVPTSTCAGGEIYTVIITPTIEDVVTVTVAASSITDIAGNPNTTPSNIVSVFYDITSAIISPIHIQSNNANSSYATTGNVITLTYSIDVDVTGKQIVTIAGTAVTPVCVPSVIPGSVIDCTATYTVPATVPPNDGLTPFSIEITAAGYEQTSTMTTDASSVTIDRSIHVLITDPGPSVSGNSFLFAGECEIGAGNVTISGTGFTPSPVTVPCVDEGYTYGRFEYDPITVTSGTVTITATQTDLAGNVGTDTDVYVLSTSTLPVVTISGPSGTTATGPNIITGTCTSSAGAVSINGTGFTTTIGSLPVLVACTGGVYSLPITIIGGATITASQTNAAGTTMANTSTSLPETTSTTVMGGGCMPGYPCSSGWSGSSSNTSTTTPVATNQTITTTSSSCPVFTQYLKKGVRDGKNGIYEVSKVQEFLNRKLGINLSIDGIFGKKTHRAVSDFQSVYFASILSPWGLSAPTGWWYQSTRSYANYLENCSEGTVQLDNTVKVHDGVIVN